MTEFKEIKGTLCRMVDPEPLTDKSQFPCVVRMIQDDSPMGKYNALKGKTKENGLQILSMVENPAIDINYIKMNEDKGN